MVIAAVVSVQTGSAIAVGLFEELGSGGVVLLRIAFAAVILMVLWRPGVRGLSRMTVRDVALFGLALAGMNLCFYAAIDRIPLGLGVTLEFVGPLGVAVAGSRRPLDGLWVVLAALGVIGLADGGGSAPLDLLGVAFALAAAALWAAYILLSKRTGEPFPAGGVWPSRWFPPRCSRPPPDSPTPVPSSCARSCWGRSRSWPSRPR